MKHELRYVEVRAAKDAPIIEGYAIRFGEMSSDLGGFREIIAPDAEIEFDDVRSLFNHDNDHVLGRLSSKTLRLERDSEGLRQSVDVPDTTWAKDLLTSMRRGDINQQSFAFRTLPDGQKWEDHPDGYLVRTIKRMRIFDVSVVTVPAYPTTDAKVRSGLPFEIRTAAEILAEDRPTREPEPQPDKSWISDLDIRSKQIAILCLAGGLTPSEKGEAQ